MGKRGTEVARQAADLVLADDDLPPSSPPSRRAAGSTPTSAGSCSTRLSGGAAEIAGHARSARSLGLPLPLLPAQILWINLLTHAFRGRAGCGAGRAGNDAARPPRPPGESVLGGGLGWRIGSIAAFLAVASLARPEAWQPARWPGPPAQDLMRL